MTISAGMQPLLTVAQASLEATVQLLEEKSLSGGAASRNLRAGLDQALQIAFSDTPIPPEGLDAATAQTIAQDLVLTQHAAGLLGQTNHGTMIAVAMQAIRNRKSVEEVIKAGRTEGKIGTSYFLNDSALEIPTQQVLAKVMSLKEKAGIPYDIPPEATTEYYLDAIKDRLGVSGQDIATNNRQEPAAIYHILQSAKFAFQGLQSNGLLPKPEITAEGIADYAELLLETTNIANRTNLLANQPETLSEVNGNAINGHLFAKIQYNVDIDTQITRAPFNDAMGNPMNGAALLEQARENIAQRRAGVTEPLPDGVTIEGAPKGLHEIGAAIQKAEGLHGKEQLDLLEAMRAALDEQIAVRQGALG